MLRGLGEEMRTKFRKKKKRKNLIAAKGRLVEMKGYLKRYNHKKFFLPFFKIAF